MSKKISFIGAGSFGFTFKLVSDILQKPALQDCELSFMDIDAQRLENLKVLLSYLFEKTGHSKQVEYTLSMEDSLRDASFIVHLTKIGCYDASVVDMEVPQKYGLYQTVGDTCGVAGVSRGLRTGVFLERMLKMIEDVSAKDAIVLNYTNPQQINVMVANRVSKVPFIGLCHSVQGTTKQMANAVGVPYEEVTYDAAGINHQSFIYKFERNGEDLYPLLKAKKDELFNEPDSGERVFATLGKTRVDLMGRVGYMVTESSQHLGEYVPFYLRTAELREQYGITVDVFKENIKRSTARFNGYLEQAKAGTLELPEPSIEYGPEIINAMVTGVPAKIYGNVINHGLIENLPADACVEVACLVDKNGVQPCHYGSIPAQIAALSSMEISVHRLAADAVINRDARSVYWAYLADPVAHSVLTPDQIKDLAKDMVSVQKEYLDGFDAADIDDI
ncbi:MAG: hypothetical protein R3Y06_07840 [Faecalibacterium sp.]